ncbi:MAG: hypothetical protein QOE75_1440 [Solirubrobacterales bacterium]|jgi:hypothetical protein|nr:hypothetical protein [Solirubrobacterales bacterium]
MTEQYGGKYVIRATCGEPIALLTDVSEQLGDRVRGPVGSAIQLDTEQLQTAEALIDYANTNPERSTFMLDLDPMASNLPPRP